MTETRLVVDGTNLGVRAWFAQKKSQYGIPVSADGRPLAGCNAVLQRLANILHDEPDITELAVVFDSGAKNFRHDRYPDYKKGRSEKDKQMVADVALLQQVFTLMGIAVVAPPGFEADDAIGTLARQAEADGKNVLVYSGDRDLYQLVSDRCTVLYPDNYGNRATPIKAADVREKFGVPPSAVPDFKALVGDKSDNIPGVKGIGDKLALPLLHKWHSVEGIYANIGKIIGQPYTLLTRGNAKREALLYLSLTRLATAPLDEQDYRIERMQVHAAAPLLTALNLIRMLDRYQVLAHAS